MWSAAADTDGRGGAVGGDIVGGGDTIDLLAFIDKGGGYTKLTHDAVVGGTESAFEVRVHDVNFFNVYFCVLHYHHDGGEDIVGAALEPEAVLVVAEDAVGFCIFKTYVFD
jgi:hypothetical protein